MTNSHQIFGLGTVVVDHQVFLEKHPEVDEKTVVTADRYQIGGPVPTALAVLARFGHQTHFRGEWGEDHYGKMIQKDFQETNIQFSPHCTRKDLRTGFAHVWIEEPTGQRTISCKRPENEFELTSKDRENLLSCTLLHLDGWPGHACLEAAQIVKRNGGKVSLDTGSMKSATRSVIPFVDILNCPAHFPEQLFGTSDPLQAGNQLLELGPKLVTITLGKEGVHLFTGESHQFITGFEVEAVDTTGAGDVFCGALIHAFLENMSPVDATRFASVTAALKCRKRGNRDALPELDQIMSHLENS